MLQVKNILLGKVLVGETVCHSSVQAGSRSKMKVYPHLLLKRMYLQGRVLQKSSTNLDNRSLEDREDML